MPTQPGGAHRPRKVAKSARLYLQYTPSFAKIVFDVLYPSRLVVSYSSTTVVVW